MVDGQKTFTTWGSHADVMYLACRTDPDAPRHRGISIFQLDLHQKGVSFGPLFNLGGGRQNHTYLENVRVPHTNLIGERPRLGPDHGRVYGGNIGAMYMDMQRRLDLLVAYRKTARRNGRLLIDHQVVRDQLAEMDLLVQAERLLTYESLSNIQAKNRPPFAGAISSVVNKENMPRFAELTNKIVGPAGQQGRVTLDADRPPTAVRRRGSSRVPQPRRRHLAGQADGARHPRPRPAPLGGTTMDINLEDHQVELNTVARDFFDEWSPVTEVRRLEEDERGYDPAVWAEMQADWLRLGHDESVGGVGGGTLDLVESTTR